MNNIWTGAGAALDNGTCCGSRTAMAANAYGIDGAVKTAAITAANNDASLLKWNAYACVAWSNKQEIVSNATTNKVVT